MKKALKELESANKILWDIITMLSDTGDLADDRWAAGLNAMVASAKMNVRRAMDLIKS